MKKKIITYVVMGMLAICTAGCGNSEEKSNNTEMKENVQSDNKETDENKSEENDNYESKDEESEKESGNLEELYFISGDDKVQVEEWYMIVSGKDRSEQQYIYYYYGPISGPKNDTGARYPFINTGFFVNDEYEKFEGTLEQFLVDNIAWYAKTARITSDNTLEEYNGEYVEINGYEMYKFNAKIVGGLTNHPMKSYITGYVFDVEGYKGMMFGYVKGEFEDETLRNEAQHNVDIAVKGFRYEAY